MGTPVQLVPNIPKEFAQVRLTTFERWGSGGLLFAASMINYVDRGSLSVALPLISADLGLSPTIEGTSCLAFSGLIASCRYRLAGEVTASIPSGFMLELLRFGRLLMA